MTDQLMILQGKQTIGFLKMIVFALFIKKMAAFQRREILAFAMRRVNLFFSSIPMTVLMKA